MTAPQVGRAHVLWVKAWWRGSEGKWIPVTEATTLHPGFSGRRVLSELVRHTPGLPFRILPAGSKPKGAG